MEGLYLIAGSTGSLLLLILEIPPYPSAVLNIRDPSLGLLWDTAQLRHWCFWERFFRFEKHSIAQEMLVRKCKLRGEWYYGLTHFSLISKYLFRKKSHGEDVMKKIAMLKGYNPMPRTYFKKLLRSRNTEARSTQHEATSILDASLRRLIAQKDK